MRVRDVLIALGLGSIGGTIAGAAWLAGAAAEDREIAAADFHYSRHGTIDVLQPMNRAANEWAEASLDYDDWQRLTLGGFAFLPEAGPGVIRAATYDGFSVREV